jgi:hypothetical protein
VSKPKLQGPRPLRKHLTDHIPLSNPPRSAAEALSIGSSRYINRRGRVVGLRQIDNPRRHGPTPLSHTGTETLSSRKGNRGATQRNQSTVQATLQDFQEWGKRNGYSEKQIKDTFQRFQKRNRNQAASVPTGYHNDHTLPHKSTYYQAGENYRNKGILSEKVNGYKTDKMPTPQEMRSLRIPTSITELIRMEFNDVKPPNPKKVQKLASQIAADPTRIRARDNNTRLDAAKLRYMQELIDKGLSKSREPKPKPNSKPRSNLRIAGVLSNNGSGSEIVDHVNGKMHLFAPHLAELGFELL